MDSDDTHESYYTITELSDFDVYPSLEDVLAQHPDDGFVVSHNMYHRDYIVVESPSRIERLIESSQHPTFCELVRESTPCRLFFDVDEVAPREPPTVINHFYDTIRPVYEKIKVTLSGMVDEAILDDLICIVYNGSREVHNGFKISFHVIFPQLVFKDIGEMKKFISMLDPPPVFDRRVYRRNGLLRLPYCHKDENSATSLVYMHQRYCSLDIESIFEHSVVTAPPTPDAITYDPPLVLEDTPMNIAPSVILDVNPNTAPVQGHSMDCGIVNTLRQSLMLSSVETECISKMISLVPSLYPGSIFDTTFTEIIHTSSCCYYLQIPFKSGCVCPVHHRVHDGRSARNSKAAVMRFDFDTFEFSIRCFQGGDAIEGELCPSGEFYVYPSRMNKREKLIRSLNSIQLCYKKKATDPMRYIKAMCKRMKWNTFKHGDSFMCYQEENTLWNEQDTLSEQFTRRTQDDVCTRANRFVAYGCASCQQKCVDWFDFSSCGYDLELESGDSIKLYDKVANSNAIDHFNKHAKYVNVLQDERRVSMIDLQPHLLPINRNLVVDLRDGSTRDRLPSDLFSMCLDVDLLSFEDPRVTKVDNLLKDAFPDEHEFFMFTSSLGSLLFAEVERERVFFIWVGEGRNCKSVTAELLATALDPTKFYKATENSFLKQNSFNSQEGHSAGLLSLRGKRVMTLAEFNDEDVIDISKLKQLSAGDTFSARGAYAKTAKNFKSVATPIIHTNQIPKFNADRATLDRILLVEFNQRFVSDPDPDIERERKADPDLVADIMNDRSAVFSCLVKYAVQYSQYFRSNEIRLQEKWPESWKESAQSSLVNTASSLAISAGMFQRTTHEYFMVSVEAFKYTMKNFCDKNKMKFQYSACLQALKIEFPECEVRKIQVNLKHHSAPYRFNMRVIHGIRLDEKFLRAHRNDDDAICISKYNVPRCPIERLGLLFKESHSELSWKRLFLEKVRELDEKGKILSACRKIIVGDTEVDLTDGANTYSLFGI